MYKKSHRQCVSDLPVFSSYICVSFDFVTCNDRVEKQKAAAAAQEKASLKPQQEAASAAVTTPASELTDRLENDLKQQKAVMAQNRLSELQGKAVTSSTTTPSSSLISRIRLVQPSPSVSSRHLSTVHLCSLFIVDTI